MSWIPCPIDTDADITPVTVHLQPAQAARLEVVLAHCRDHSGLDDNAVTDMLFETGLQAAERAIQISALIPCPQPLQGDSTAAQQP
ncbi:hypothetical protein E6C76_20330 [Pseudothauera nasutitermitis]|uniref:Uncharacterized protein n=1 Tax=Pseudothauera nasutitermitis TaxID=2565930 RepID=A0A4S4AP49_9RHOO|nr:hypothetical protein [Pseudothauera nasutitermitis]THF61431.1 hypothetical protein E6C76_20330 [Pseudothauera nasutitermitis]